MKKLLFIITACCLPFSQTMALRIVSIAPSITEQVFELKAGDDLAGVTSFCRYPDGAAGKEKIGNIIELNIEKIVSLKPDIVIGTSINAQSRTEKLVELGFRVEIIPEGGDFSGMCESLVSLGRLIGREAQAESLVSRYSRDLKSLSPGDAVREPERVIFIVGVQPLIIAGQGSYISDILEKSGATNVADTREAYTRYSMEALISADPDTLILSMSPKEAEQAKMQWQRYKDLKAVKEDRVHQVDPDLFGLATPRRFIESVKVLRDLLASE